MKVNITWSLLASQDLENCLEYLSENWSKPITIKFLNRLEESINLISENPVLFLVINKKNSVRKCVVTKHNTLFYRVNGDKVEIIRLFDSRQNPENLRFK